MVDIRRLFAREKCAEGSARTGAAVIEATRAEAPASASKESVSDAVACYHCGESVPAGLDLTADIDGASQPMCCAGCRAVAQLIHSAGLKRYYDFRDALPERPDDMLGRERFLTWDRTAVLEHY